MDALERTFPKTSLQPHQDWEMLAGRQAAISQNISSAPPGAGRCWLAAETWLYPGCQESVLKWSCLSRMLLPAALGLTRGWHSPMQSDFLFSMTTSGVLLILGSSFSPIPSFNDNYPLSLPDHAKKLPFLGEHPANPASPVPQQTGW